MVRFCDRNNFYNDGFLRNLITYIGAANNSLGIIVPGKPGSNMRTIYHIRKCVEVFKSKLDYI